MTRKRIATSKYRLAITLACTLFGSMGNVHAATGASADTELWVFAMGGASLEAGETTTTPALPSSLDDMLETNLSGTDPYITALTSLFTAATRVGKELRIEANGKVRADASTSITVPNSLFAASESFQFPTSGWHQACHIRCRP